MGYYISKIVKSPFHKAVDLTKKALGEQGFGILTEIDVKETLKKKLDVDFREYKILGACNPEFAYKALRAEETIGVMLPCSVVVQETKDGTVEVAAVDPATAMESIRNPALAEIANEVRDRLVQALESLGS